MNVDKPWGQENIWAITDKYVGKIITINPGCKLSRQYHQVKDETIYVLEGKLILELGEGDKLEKQIHNPGSRYRIKPGQVHRFCAPSEGCKLIEVSTPELIDVVRLEDDYNRVP
jgi:mannose-6-phosphate isomerase